MNHLKEKLLSYFIAFEEQVEKKSFLHSHRLDSFAEFEKTGFPSKGDEAWKYSYPVLLKLLQNDYSIFPKELANHKLNDLKEYFLTAADSYKIVFVDGIYNPFLSHTSHQGHDICVLSSASVQNKYKDILNTYYNKLGAKQEDLIQLNTAYVRDGAYIHIPKNTVVDYPIEIINFSTGKQQNPLFIQPRNLIVVEENAQVEIIEKHHSIAPHEVLTNVVSEVFVAKGAQVNYYKLQNDLDTASLIDNTFIRQEEKSEVGVYTFSFGGNFIRNNLNFYQEGSRINSILKGVTLIEKEQHVDNYTLVHHQHPNCESHQDYKGVYFDRSTGVFNGKIKVEKEAQKTNAFQQNNNIIFTDTATINTKPQLEIFADDVKCSHGCTVGQIDKKALFYLQSRGISHKEAKAILTYAFTNNIIEELKNPFVKKKINEILAEKLGFNLQFSFH